MKHLRGYTLIEVMVVVTIAAILMGLAAPSFVRTVRSTTISNSVNSFMSDMRYARSESIRRGVSVVVCRSNAPEAASPVCNTGSGIDIDGDGLGDGWASGWIIFEDLDGDGSKDSAEAVLKVESQNTRIESVMETGSGSTKFRFTPTGRLRSLSGATQLTFGGLNYTNDLQRVVCVSMAGHVRIAGDGTTTCS